MIVSFLAALTLSTVLNPQTCTMAGRCGECYNTGKPGIRVQRGKYQDCDTSHCNSTKRGHAIAFVDVPPERGESHPKLMAEGHDGIPNPQRGTGQGTAKLIVAYTPPVDNGPSKTINQGTRLV